MRRNYRRIAQRGAGELEEYLEKLKEQGRYGADEVDPEVWALWGYGGAPGAAGQPFFGLTIAACENGAMRQSVDGLIV